ncbi:MAG: O-antigen ligase family protein [Minicystis sp.]
MAIAAVAHDPRAPAADTKRALGLLVAVVALAAATARPRAGRVLPPAVLAFVGFAAWSGLTLIWGVPAGARDLGTWVAAAGLAVVCSTQVMTEARHTAERAAVLTGSAAAAIAVAQRIGGARGLFVHGGQGNANWLGLLLAVTLPLAIGLFVRLHREGASRARTAAIAATLLQLVGLVLSHSRVAWAATALAVTGLLISLVLKTSASKRRAFAALGLAVAIAIPLAVATIPDRADTHAASAPTEAEDVPVPIAWRGRLWIWRSSADAALASLPLGAGLGGFGHAYLDAQGHRLAALEPKAASRRFLNATTAHSDWIEILVDAGLPALALLALTVGFGARAAARSGWTEGAAALAAFAICAAGDSPLRQPGLVMVLALVLAGCVDPSRTGSRLAIPPRLTPHLRLGLLLASAWLLSIAAGTWLAARRLTAAKESLPAARRALLASAARLDPRSGEIALERGLLDLESGDPEAALPALRRSRALLANVGTDVALGNAEAQLGHHEAAVVAYRDALRRHPGSFRAHANITQPLLALGRIEEAARHLTIASALWPGNPRLGEMAEQVRRARVERDAAR